MMRLGAVHFVLLISSYCTFVSLVDIEFRSSCVPQPMCGSNWKAFISEQRWVVTKTNYTKMNRNERISWMVNLRMWNEFGTATMALVLFHCDIRPRRKQFKWNHSSPTFLSSAAEINCTHRKWCRRNKNWKNRRCVIKALEYINESSK